MKQETTSNPLSSYFPFLIVLLLLQTFFLGILFTKVQYFEKGLLVGGTTDKKGVTNTGDSLNEEEQAPRELPIGSSDNVEKLREDDRVRGDRTARVLLIEYSDLECPYCKQFHKTAQEIVDEYKGQVAWVYRHFPIVQLHSKAPKESEAVECAAEQGGQDAFWKLTDKIYEVTPSNDGLDHSTLPDLASQVGLDPVAFKTCFDSGRMKERVDRDYQSGVKAGVQGTPGNILLDTKSGKTITLRGAEPFESVKQQIDRLLQEKT